MILSALKYFFKNFLPLALFSLPAAIFLAIKYNHSLFFNYIFNTGIEEGATPTFIKIYEHFSLLPSINIFMILLWSALLILSFCLIFAYIERHMKYGISSYIKAVKSVNYSVMVVLPAYLTIIALEELFAMLNSLFVRLLGVTGGTFGSVIIPIIYLLLLVVLFLIYAILSLWIPVRMVTGYSNRDSIRYSIRLTQGRQVKIMLGLIFPLIVTAPVMILLKQLSLLQELNTVIYALCYIFILGYLCAYVMAAYFKYSGTERKDIKNKIFRKFKY